MRTGARKRGKMRRVFRAVCVLAIICLVGCVILKSQPRTHTSVTEYPGYVLADIPASAQDFQAVTMESPVHKYYLYSFVLEEDAYESYKEYVLDYYNVDLQDEDSLKYGTAGWYGMKVADVSGRTPNYDLDDFAYGLPYEKVIDDDVNDYTVIIYSPVNTGSYGLGILANDEEQRIMCYYYAGIR